MPSNWIRIKRASSKSRKVGQHRYIFIYIYILTQLWSVSWLPVSVNENHISTVNKHLLSNFLKILWSLQMITKIDIYIGIQLITMHRSLCLCCYSMSFSLNWVIQNGVGITCTSCYRIISINRGNFHPWSQLKWHKCSFLEKLNIAWIQVKATWGTPQDTTKAVCSFNSVFSQVLAARLFSKTTNFKQI